MWTDEERALLEEARKRNEELRKEIDYQPMTQAQIEALKVSQLVAVKEAA